MSLSNLRQLRQRLHANPYVANNEGWTAAALYNFLRSQNVEISHTRVNKSHGFIAKVVGCATSSSPSGQSDSVLLRADMDALPLHEETPNIPYLSQNDGCHHACGHDGHSTMLAGALVALQNDREHFHGEVYGLFQPAEETGEGAKQMLDGNIPLPTAGCFGLHNIPGAPMGQILLRDDGVAARASCGMSFVLEGKASHASEPWLGISPAGVIGSLVLDNSPLMQLPQQLLDSGLIPPQIQGGAVLATPVHLSIGSSGDYGILPGNGKINLTLRADTTTDLDTLRDAVHALIRKTSIAGGCQVKQMTVIEPFPATINTPERSNIVRAAANDCSLKVKTMKAPFPWSEDFAYYGERCDSGAVLFGVGSGEECAPLHSKHYDFPDQMIDIVVPLWVSIAKKALQ